MGSYNKPSAKSSADAASRPPLPFISETPVYEPKWYQFFPGFDLTLPIGANYAPEGRASVMQNGEFGTNHGGDFNIGVGGTYNNVWNFQLTYRNFFGSTEYQHYADRDYVSFFIRRAF